MKERIEKWDNVKTVLITLVVIGHVCDQYLTHSPFLKAVWILIYSFHMPLFFFVSGLFSKRRIREHRYAEMTEYLWLYLAAYTAIFLTKLVFLQEYDIQLLNTKDAPWFLFVLFFCYLITAAVSRFRAGRILGAFLLLGCLAGYDSAFSDMFQLSRLAVFFPFFFMGFMIDERKVRRFVSPKWLRAVGAVILLLTAILVFRNIEKIYWIRPLLTGRNPYTKLPENLHLLGGMIRAAWYIMASALSLLVIAIIPGESHRKWLSLPGRNSLQIFILHRPCIIFLCQYVGIGRYLSKIWPQHFHLLAIPLAVGIMLLCLLPVLFTKKAADFR